jgi:flagellar hook-length control protein FliK
MNIDSLNLLSLLSTGDSLEKLQQTMQPDETLSEEFADLLLDKIRQLTSSGEEDYLPESFTNGMFGEGNAQHEIAGWLNERGINEDFISLFGKGLPMVNKLEKDIDLDNTLEALANVMNTLEQDALEHGNLEIKLEALIEKVEDIKTAIPEQVAMDGKLGKIIDELKIIKDDISKHQGGVNGKLSKTDKQLIEGEEATLAKQEQYLDEFVGAINQIKDVVGEESFLLKGDGLVTQIERLAEDIESIKAIFSNNSAAKLAEKKIDDTTRPLQIESIEDADDNLQLASQIAAIVATLNKPQDTEKMTVGPGFQEPKPEHKKEALSLKQMTEERALGIASKSEPESLMQQENASRKPGQENPAIVAKQNEKTDFLDTDAKKPELGNEKVSPRFATDIASLNRAVMHENKADVAPMSRHFAHPEWNKEIAERVIWMHKQEIPAAELRLNPRHLGPITIRVDVTQDQATVAFTAQHAAVKEAIEAALPKLREMFSAQQLSLAEVNVSQEDTGQRQARSFAQMGSNSDRSGQKEKDEVAGNEQAEKAKEIADEIEAGRAIASNGILSIFA